LPQATSLAAQAPSLAAEIKTNFGFDTELIAGAGGIFDVQAEDEIVFSKQAVNRFPEAAEVIESLKRVQAR